MKHKIIVSLAYILVCLMAAFISVNTSLDKQSDYTITLDNSAFSPSLESHAITEASFGYQKYQLDFTKNDLASLNTDTYILILNKITDNSVKVSLNEHVIHVVGDLDQGRSNLKNSVSYTTFSDKHLEATNHLVIETFASYKSGLDTSGIIISDATHGMTLYRGLNYYNYSIVVFSLGFLAFSMIFILTIYFLSSKKDISYIYCAIATFFFMVYFMDYIKIPMLGYDYLLFKKIFMMSLYLGAGFYTLALSRFFYTRFLKYIVGVTVFGFAIITLMSPTMLIFKHYYNLWYVVFLANFMAVFIASIINLKRSEYAYLFLIGFLSAGSFATASIIYELTGHNFPINSPMIYIVVLAALPLLIGIDHLTFYEQELMKEKFLRKTEVLRANTDGLTGAWNQRYLTNLLHKSKDGYIITMIDLDDFKQINDQYGHLAGDAALIHITKLINNHLDSTDTLCRYGGDEFVILSKCDGKNALKEHQAKMEKLCEDLAHSHVIHGSSNFFVTASIGFFQWTDILKPEFGLKKADEALYKSKELGKNRVYLLH